MTDELDDRLLADLASAFDEVEPVPTHLSDAARSALSWRRADAELAELLYDSAEADLVGVRGTGTDRRAFRFGTNDGVLRVHVTADSLVLMLEPPVAVDCRVTGGDEVETHRTDDFGELVIPAPSFPIRVEVDLPGGTTITPWITG